jgi:hypothetical protein
LLDDKALEELDGLLQADCSRSELRFERPAAPEAAGHWQLALSSHRLRRLPLNFRLLKNLQGIINLDAKVQDAP